MKVQSYSVAKIPELGLKLIVRKVFRCPASGCGRERIAASDIVVHQCCCGESMEFHKVIADRMIDDREYIFDKNFGIFRELNSARYHNE